MQFSENSTPVLYNETNDRIRNHL